ncbi:unnamed protein product [Closterium sp. NIES-53]
MSFTRQPAPPPPRPRHLPPTAAAVGGERQGRGWICSGSQQPPYPHFLPPNSRNPRGKGDGGGEGAAESCWHCHW